MGFEQFHEPTHELPEETRTGRATVRPALADLTTCLKSGETAIPAACEPCPFGFGTRIVVPTLTDGAWCGHRVFDLQLIGLP